MEKVWFIFKGTHHLGPFSVEEIGEFYRSKEITAKTLIWKEGVEKWEPLSKVSAFSSLFKNADETPPAAPKPPPKVQSGPPPLPSHPLPPKFPAEIVKHHLPETVEIFDDELPPPIPLDAILDPKGEKLIKIKKEEKKQKANKYVLFFGAAVFIIILGWFYQNERQSSVQLKIKGLMPVYLETLTSTASKTPSSFEASMALSLDGLTLWASTNLDGEIESVIKLTSIPKRVLGNDDVELTVKGKFKNHVGKFTRMVLMKGSKFLPGEYNFHIEGRKIHFINSTFKSLSAIGFFKSLNSTVSYDGTTLIYSGTPREFEKKLSDFQSAVVSESLKPLQDKLERMQTFESLVNQTTQNYLMELEKIKTGAGVSSFEQKFMKEVSPLLQSLVVKAHELSEDPKYKEIDAGPNAVAPYSNQVLIGKQIGEMASDMITRTQKHKKLKDADKSALRTEFEKRAQGILLQINLNIKRLEAEIKKLSSL